MYFTYRTALPNLPVMDRHWRLSVRNAVMLRPFTRLHEPLAFVRQFTPNWFAMTMGTGVLAQVVARLPLSFPGQLLLAEGLWWLTALLFVLFSLLFAARLLLFRDTLWPMLDHPVQSAPAQVAAPAITAARKPEVAARRGFFKSLFDKLF